MLPLTLTLSPRVYGIHTFSAALRVGWRHLPASLLKPSPLILL